jgi:TP901 family phage tail tape measure protein
MAEALGGSGKPIDFNNFVGGEEALQVAARAVRSLKKDVNDLGKTVGDDSGRIKAGFETIKQGIADIQSKAGKLQLFSGEDKAVLAALAQQLGELKKRQEDYKATQAAQVTIQRGLTDSVKNYNSELAKQKQALIEAQKAGDVNAQKAAAAAIRATTQETKDLGRAARGLTSELTAARGSYDALSLANGKLLGQLRGLEGGLESTSKEAQDLRLQISANNQALLTFDKAVGISLKNVGNYPTVTQQAGASIASFTQGLTASYFSLQAIADGFKAVFEANIKYSDQLADVEKTTGLSAAATDKLGDSLKKLDTRTSLEGLLDIAAVGGQLGVAGKDIEGFSKSVDIANQALSDDFGDNAAQIAEELGKIRTVFSKQLTGDVSQDILLIGSAINELGAAGAATAPQLADVALRVGATAANAGLGLKDVLAYASVLQELGFGAEVSGSGLNRLFSTLSTRSKAAFDIAKLADANLTLKQFKNLVNNDFSGALQLFLRGLREGGTSTTKFNALLGTLKLQSGEAKSVITSLAQNIDLYTERQSTANEQLKIGTSLSEEAAKKNNNLAGSWAKLKNDVGNFFTSGVATSALKWLVDATRASLNLSGGIGETARRFGQAVGIVKAPVDDLGQSLADQALVTRKAADETERLMARFVSLSAITKPTAEQTSQLRETVLALKDKLGESVVVLNEQTQRYELNSAAVTKNYKAQRAAYLENVVSLAKRLQGLEDERSKSFALSEALKEEAATKEKLVRANTALKTGSLSALDYDVQQRAKTPVNYDRNLGAVKPEVLAAYTQYIELTKQADAATGKAVITEKKRDEVLRQLERLGLDSSSALALLAQATADDTKKTDDSVEKDKKKKQSLADVLKAELELQKARLEAQAKDYDRQAENVANPDEIRVRAAQKAVAARKQIAKLDEAEQIHEAELKNAKLINGDKALAVERVLISENTLNKIKELDFNGMRAIVAIRQAGADQLTEIEKQQLDTEAKALETIGADENKSYAERQDALLAAAAKRIEIIHLESDIKRRAAKGDAEVLKKIQLEEDAAADEQLKKLRSPDADKLNDDLDKRYAASQLALEKSRAASIFTERQYRKELERIDLAYLEKKLENLKKDSTKQQEAADLEVEINRRKNDNKAKDDAEAREKALRIIDDVGRYSTEIEQGYFAIRQNLLDARAANIEQQYKNEVEAAGQNAVLLADIEKRHDKELRKLDYERAKASRDQALIEIAINTAVAVAKAFAEYPFPFALIPAGIALAQGLLQTAVVTSKPLPQYFRGRQDGPAELAEVSERGPELIHRKKTGLFEYVPMRSIVQLEAHDRVIPHAVTTEMLATAGLSHSQAAYQPTQVTQALSGAANGAAQAREMSANRGYDKLAENLAANTAALKKIQAPKITVHKGSDADVETSNQLTHYVGTQRRFLK